MSDSRKIDQIQSKVDQVAETLNKIDKDVALQQAALEAHTKQDEKMYEEFKRMNDVLQENTESLKVHIQNNMLLKDMIQKMDDRLSPIELEHIQKTAVREWVLRTSKLIAKVGGAIGVVAAGVMWLKPILQHWLLK
jgi:chromosome segregation ATPase